MRFGLGRPVLSVVTVFKGCRNVIDSSVDANRLPLTIERLSFSCAIAKMPLQRDDALRDGQSDGLRIGDDAEFLPGIGHEEADGPFGNSQDH